MYMMNKNDEITSIQTAVCRAGESNIANNWT